MFKEKIDGRRLTAWLSTAAVAPAAGIYGGTWLPVLLLGIVCAVASVCVLNICQGKEEFGTPFAIIQWIWLVLFLGSIAPRCAECWSGKNLYPVIPVVLLVLAAFSASKGAERASRACTTLFWMVFAVLISVLLAGVDSLDYGRLTPELELPKIEIIPVLLLPCVSVLIPNNHKKTNLLSLLIPIFAVIFSIWVNAALSKTVCEDTDNPFFEYCKGITLFGSVERFEAIVACVLTAGWFSLFSYLLSAAGSMFQREWAVWLGTAAAAGMVILRFRIPAVWIAIGAVAVWCILPVINSVGKKSKKGLDKGGEEC